MNLFNEIGDYAIFGWSVSGNETAVVVKNKKQKVNFCFDIGIAPPPTVNCDNVFISHGHIDHVASLPLHCRKRMLIKVRPAKYYLPVHLIEPMKRICAAFSEMHECENGQNFEPELIGVKVGDVIQINSTWIAQVISSHHRTEVSLGYMLYNTKVSQTKPEISYLGDTSFTVFSPNPSHEHLLFSRILITELTYVDTRTRQNGSSKNYGHSSLTDFIGFEDIFDEVETIVFIHFSPRYSTREILKNISQSLPSLKNKILCPFTGQDSCY